MPLTIEKAKPFFKYKGMTNKFSDYLNIKSKDLYIFVVDIHFFANVYPNKKPTFLFMNTIQYLHRKRTYFKRLKIKKESVKVVLAHDTLSNKEVVNVHRTDATNAGDFYSGPHHYFEPLKNRSLDIFDYKVEDKAVRDRWVHHIVDDALIIGGGGLLCLPAFNRQMKLFEKLKAKNKKTVLWGVGHNSPHPLHFNKIKNYNVDPGSFGLAGVRDYGMKAEWVPCVSCLHPVFDRKVEEKRDVGIIFHKKTLARKKGLRAFEKIPSLFNNDLFEKIVTFIGETRTIITSSYHAMYWAMLLEKRVVVFPNSSKFFDFKYQPVISDPVNYKTDIKKARSYSGVLEECRTINVKFAEKVFNYLNL